MESPVPRPETINKLRFAADAALAMLAGMQLDVFTPLQAGPKTAEEIAHAIGVGPARLRLLLYSLACQLIRECNPSGSCCVIINVTQPLVVFHG